MNKRIKYPVSAIFIMLSFFFMTASADNVENISGEATYYDDGTHSRMECMRLAAEQARINALAKAFGTVISQNIMQTERSSGDREHNDFLALSSTEVKGEWIADSEEPKYEFSRDKEENLIVTCRVKGKARKITNEDVAFEALVLRNGDRKEHASTSFRSGDDMRLYFRGAADGYLNVFLEDEDGNVLALLPYPKDSKSEVKVKKDREYIFFNSHGDKGEFGPVEELEMTANNRLEYNRVYVVFSPNVFSRPVMQTGEIPYTSSREFSKWLVKARRNDSRMGVKAINLQIEPKE